MGLVLGADLDDMVDDRELDQIQLAKLMKFGLSESSADGHIAWAKDASRKQRLDHSKTAGLRAGTLKIVSLGGGSQFHG